jgi:oligosaccharyltransferase complex subunit beta
MLYAIAVSLQVLAGNPMSTLDTAAYAAAASGGPVRGGVPQLVVAVQARNNARVVVAGSVEMFTNYFFAATIDAEREIRVGNERFCLDITLWAFAQTGVLRYRDVFHSKADGTPPETALQGKDGAEAELAQSMYPDPEVSRDSLVYRVRDRVAFSLVLEEFAGYREGIASWRPFVAEDVQIEFVMLDAHVRTALTPCRLGGACGEVGTHRAEFSLPDQHGVFKFRVLYRRSGYSVIHTENQVTVRPFKRNEFERFIPAAYPYYATVFSLMFAFIALVFVLQFT